jgi:2-oxoglutarate ferredoxin oxidoreductase subunit gamma
LEAEDTDKVMKSLGEARRYELMMAGLGGQGVLLTTQLVISAGISEFLYASWFPSYATLVRGGDCEGTAILSDEPIYSPLIFYPKALIVMNQTSLQAFSERIKPGCLLILDSSLIKEWTDREDVETVKVPATDQAARLGSSQSANLLLLGVYLKKTGALGLDLLEKALQEKMTQENKESFLPKNLEALRWGYQHVD